jgi:serine/threonine protein kinase
MLRLHVACLHCRSAFQSSLVQVVKKLHCPFCHLSFPFPNLSQEEPLWLVLRGSRKVGPFTHDHLVELVRSNQLAPKDRLLAMGATESVPASAVPGLFASMGDSSDVLSCSSPTTPEGPLSVRGIKVKVNFSLTLGDFQILRKLGAGGMGAVYLAVQRSRNQTVAIKVLSETLAGNDTFINRFYREVLTLSSLEHPNVVRFIGAGQEKGIPFFAMEYIEGISTAHLVKRQGRLSIPDALYIIRQSAEALGYALKQKIVHRDIKPENIMITRAGQIKLADMGLAKSLEDDLNLTDTGAALGSPKYMAPEQSRNAKNVDHRSDIYALGGVLYHFLTEDVPFKGGTPMELLLAKEHQVFTPARRINPEVSARLDLIIDKMLAREPKYRYQSYGELLRDLATLGMTGSELSQELTQALPTDTAEPPTDLIEILLVDDDFETDVRLARQALEENNIPSNLVVVKDGAEARAFLRREGKYLLAPHPHLIIFGTNLNPSDSLLTLQEVNRNEALRNIPLVLLADSPEIGRFFEEHGIEVNLVLSRPDQPNQFDHLFKSVQGLCLTVVEERHA